MARGRRLTLRLAGGGPIIVAVDASLPPPETIERWCHDFIVGTDLEMKLSPPPPPRGFEQEPVARRLNGPGRPAELRVIERAPKTPRRGSLVHAEGRARLLHTFLHHELQAAELFCWAVLAFPETPREFRTGLLRLAREELGHLALYRKRLNETGFTISDFGVRDWFWTRVGACAGPVEFVSLLGLGLEGANLEHTVRFAEWFRSAGDEKSALVLERVERDEVGHVAFAREWFERFTGETLAFDSWASRLPEPLSPALFVGRPINRAARRRAGFGDAFLDSLDDQPAAHVPRRR